MGSLAKLQKLQVPGLCVCIFVVFIFFIHFHFLANCTSIFLYIVFSTPVLLCSSKARPQAWHLDSPLPNVFVNLVYLDDGQMTQFMVPGALPSSILEMSAPSSELFAPGGITSDNGKEVEELNTPLISENWLKYLKKRYYSNFVCFFSFVVQGFWVI